MFSATLVSLADKGLLHCIHCILDGVVVGVIYSSFSLFESTGCAGWSVVGVGTGLSTFIDVSAILGGFLSTFSSFFKSEKRNVRG